VARPFLLDLARVTGETVFLSVVEREEVLYIDKVDSTQAIRYIVDSGTRRPLHCTSVGKLYLVLLPEHGALEVALRHGLAHFAPATITELWQRLLGRPAPDYGRLCHGDGGPRTGRARRSVRMLPAVQPHYLSRTGRVQVPTRGDVPFAPLA
jgi:hypothetical protein